MPYRPALGALLLLLLAPQRADAFQAEVLESIVSLLPTWPGYARPGLGAPPGTAPEGTAIAIAEGGYLATALHVVQRATRIEARLADGRVLPARLVGGDTATDIAVVKLDADLPLLEPAPGPSLGEPVCAVGNAFGLDLSVTCGVVSALARTEVGFNPVEDFVQTDAAVNPGASGGALLDQSGRLVGLLSAIFTKQSDANLGVNFAVSQPLLQRVTADLVAFGEVRWAESGLRLAPADPGAGLLIVSVAKGAAEEPGLSPGDRLLAIDGRRLRRPGDATAAFALRRPGETALLRVERGGEHLEVQLPLVARGR